MLSCGRASSREDTQILIGGFGKGFTLRAALPLLGEKAQTIRGAIGVQSNYSSPTSSIFPKRTPRYLERRRRNCRRHATLTYPSNHIGDLLPLQRKVAYAVAARAIDNCVVADDSCNSRRLVMEAVTRKSILPALQANRRAVHLKRSHAFTPALIQN